MSLQNEKTLEAYEKVACNYLNSANLIADENKEKVEKESKETKDLIKEMFSSLKEGSKILEVGAANGRKSIFLESLGYQVTPSDIATDFLNEIRKNGLTPIKFNLLTDDFIEKYDGILCWRVFVHFTKEDSLNALKRSYNALNNNGIFVFSFINRDCKLVDNEWVDFPCEYHLGEDRYFNYYSKEEMDEIISKTNFKIKEFHEVVSWSGVSWLIYVLKKEENNMKINAKLKKYIEENVFPEYKKNESGHSIDHIKYVIDRSFELVEENNLDINPDMVYTIASYHDIGHHIDSKTHEIISADMMYKDENLKKFFSDEERLIIKEAIEDHRASSKDDPRTIYGRIVSSADRNNTVEACLRRTYTYGKKLDPNASDDDLYLRAHKVLLEKFGEDGYAKFYFKDSVYENFLKELRELLSDKDKFIETQKNYINKLKEENKL